MTVRLRLRAGRLTEDGDDRFVATLELSGDRTRMFEGVDERIVATFGLSGGSVLTIISDESFEMPSMSAWPLSILPMKGI